MLALASSARFQERNFTDIFGKMKNSPVNTKRDKLKVAIGPVYDEFGGVSQHILGIKKSSFHQISALPSKFSRTVLGKRGQRIWLYKMEKIGLSRYDVIHSHVSPWFTNLCLSSRTNTCKWVHTYHTLYFKEDYPKGLKPEQKRINRTLVEIASKADVKISISKWLHDYLLEKYAIQTEVIPNGIDLRQCDRANPDRFVRKYALRDFVLFVGSLDPIKNPQLFAELALRMPEYKFVMIGRNLDAIHIKNEYGISVFKNLFLLNEMKHNDVLNAISACDAFVMTSKREGIPTVLLEAMGMGKPVVAPAHSGCKEVIHSNDYGFLYEPDSLDDLVEQTKRALNSKHVGKRSMERVARHYDWKILARKIDSVYESLYK